MPAVDVKHPLRIGALDASIGRKAGLQVSHREGPECAPKPPFRCEQATVLSRSAILSGRSSDRFVVRIPVGVRFRRASMSC